MPRSKLVPRDYIGRDSEDSSLIGSEGGTTDIARDDYDEQEIEEHFQRTPRPTREPAQTSGDMPTKAGPDAAGETQNDVRNPETPGPRSNEQDASSAQPSHSPSQTSSHNTEAPTASTSTPHGQNPHSENPFGKRSQMPPHRDGMPSWLYAGDIERFRKRSALSTMMRKLRASPSPQPNHQSDSSDDDADVEGSEFSESEISERIIELKEALKTLRKMGEEKKKRRKMNFRSGSKNKRKEKGKERDEANDEDQNGKLRTENKRKEKRKERDEASDEDQIGKSRTENKRKEKRKKRTQPDDDGDADGESMDIKRRKAQISDSSESDEDSGDDESEADRRRGGHLPRRDHYQGRRKKTADENVIHASIREHMNLLLNCDGKDRAPKLGPSKRQLAEFKNEDGPGPTEADFSVVWYKNDPGRDEWNYEASRIFEKSYLRYCDNGCWDRAGITSKFAAQFDVAKIFRSKIRDYHAKYVAVIPPEKFLSKAIKARRNARRHALHAQRIEFAAANKEWSRYVKVIKRLGAEGVSSDETDEDLSRLDEDEITKVVRRISKPWRAEYFEELFAALDEHRKVARRSFFGQSVNGNHPRQRVLQAFKYNQRAAQKLPLNFYSSTWLGQQPDRMQHQIMWSAAEKLNLPKLHDANI